MFICNKYSKWYSAIISNAQNSNRVKLKKNNPDYVYYERHHIIPKCLAPDKADLKRCPDNGVLLSPREHFICHVLLVKMTTGDVRLKMKWALSNMKRKKTGQETRYINSRLYEAAKKDLGHTAESRSKMSEQRKGKSTYWLKGKPAPNRGISHSDETKKKISETKKKNYVRGNNPRLGKPSPLKGRKLGPYSEERRAKMSKAHIGKTAWNKGLTKEDPRVKKNIENMAKTRYDKII